MASDAAGAAANTQAAATDRSIAEQRRQFETTRSDTLPYRQAGSAAINRLQQLLGLPTTNPSGMAAMMSAADQMVAKKLWAPEYAEAQKSIIQQGPEAAKAARLNELVNDGVLSQEAWNAFSQPQDKSAGSGYGDLIRRFTNDDLQADPVYQSGLKFGQEEGEKAINARALQGGGYDSGATLKALTRFGTDYGSTKANDSYNRFTNDQNNVFNRLSGVSGAGQVATNQVASTGTNAANSISGSIDAAGNARAAGIVGGANAWGNAFSGVNGAINQYQNSEILKKLLAGGNKTTSSFDPYQVS
jgi:hypothetical protein